MSHSIKYFCKTEDDTISLAKRLAKISKIRDVFLLNGTLGVGKTVFARAFIIELSNAKEVPSPTFTLMQVYEGKDFDIFHFDLYRIKSAEEIFEIGIEEAIYSGVSLIEWSNKMSNYLPKDVFEVNISINPDNSRTIEIITNSSEKQQRLEHLKG